MGKTIALSVIILTKNEEEMLPDCLASIAWADEIIVIDNGSNDKTINIAEKSGARVIRDHAHSFSSLRDTGKEHARGDWILYIDADERVPELLKKEIEQIIKDFTISSSPHGYFIQRKNYYLGKLWPTQDRMQRFFFRTSLQGWFGPVHETAKVDGTVSVLHEPLLHFTHRTLESMIAKTNLWSETEAKLRLDEKHPPVVWWRFLRVIFTGFFDSFIKQQGWRAGTVGWIESTYQGFSLFITYAKLWELQHKTNK